MGVVATQLMDASPQVGLGEMSGACKLGETPGDQPTVTSPKTSMAIAGKPPFLFWEVTFLLMVGFPLSC